MNSRRRRCPHPAVSIALLALGVAILVLAGYQKRIHDLVAEGARAIGEQRLDERALEEAAGSMFVGWDVIAYNRGVRAAVAGHVDAALDHFRAVIAGSSSLALRAKAHYNLGNLLARAGRPREAIAMYRETLRLDPGDWDAKANLESLALRHSGDLPADAEGALKPVQKPGQREGDPASGSGSGSAPDDI
jgi:tetratricopeptide (TPR) repeat protein